MFGFRKKATPTTEESQGAKRPGSDLDKELAKLGIFVTPDVDEDDGDLEDELLALLNDDESPAPSPRKRQSRSPQPQSVTPAISERPIPSPLVQPHSVFEQLPKIPQRAETNVSSNSSVQSQGSESDSLPKPEIGINIVSPQRVATPSDNLPPSEDLFKAPPPPANVLEALEQRLAKYKSEVERSKEPSKSRRMGRIVKQYEEAIVAHKKGRAVAFAELPTPPGFHPIPGQAAAAPINLDALPGMTDVALPPAHGNIPANRSSQPSQHQTIPNSNANSAPVLTQPKIVSPLKPTSAQSSVSVTLVDSTEEPRVTGTNAAPLPNTVLQALEQRLVVYKSEIEKANASSNAGKARRMGRIVKQYEEAIMAHKKGKPVPFDELPTPPGFPPIPGQAAPAPINLDSLPGLSDVPTPESSVAAPSAGPEKSGVVTGGQPIVRGGTKFGGKLTLQEKQLAVILSRQKAFKAAALTAKQRGDLDQARELLRTAKGFDKLIQVSQAGLPVDMATLPAGPEAIAALESEDFEVVTASDCIPGNLSTADVFAKLEEDLKEQLKMCMRTRDHFKKMGDIASANRFERLALDSKRDLDALRLAARKGDVLPSYHYETRIFSITECNSDLGDDEIEVSILRGINYKAGIGPDTFVKIEMAYPSAEQVQVNKTAVFSNAEYESIYKFAISRAARNFHRFVHRHGVKCEVWSKGGFLYGLRRLIFCRSGFLRSSTLIGVATVKLLPLETKCSIHEAFDILEGRKSVGKLEVKVRVREPILTKQISQQKQKWLSIDRT